MKIKLTDEKYLNLYRDGNYRWAERENAAGAVSILPIIKADTKKNAGAGDTAGEQILFIKEYRPPIGKWIYQLPAGLIDPGETPAQAAARELKEETGADAVSIEEITGGFTSAGLTNEYATMFMAEAVLSGGQNLSGGEKIQTVLVPIGKVKEFVLANKESFCLRSALSALIYCS